LLTELNFKLVIKHPFQLTFGGETVTIWFGARQFPNPPSEMIFAKSVSKQCAYSH